MQFCMLGLDSYKDDLKTDKEKIQIFCGCFRPDKKLDIYLE